MEFSVLCSVYYKEKPEWLEAAIKSIYNQTLVPNQVVLVKDGVLTEELEATISKMQSMYDTLDIISMNENKGLAKALSEGLKYCKYDLVARMDTDDISLPNRFEIQVREFQNDKEIVLVGTHVYEFYKNIEEVKTHKKVPLTYEEIFKYSKKRNPFNHMSVMFKKNAIEQVGGYIDSLYTEDYYLWVRLMRKYKCKNIDYTLVYARTGEEMFLRRGGLKYAKSEYQLQKNFRKLGHINNREFFINLIIRILIRLIPSQMRKAIYIMVLRRKIK